MAFSLIPTFSLREKELSKKYCNKNFSKVQYEDSPF